MYPLLLNTIHHLAWDKIHNTERKNNLQPLIAFVQQKLNNGQLININFICTHNSRRSHLAQIWAQVAAAYFHIPNVACYSGGTEETTLFTKIIETLAHQGFNIFKIGESENAVYGIKYDDNFLPIIGFSKKHDSLFNPVSGFAAVLTCSTADGECPFIAGAEVRIPIMFDDPKISDNTPQQVIVYTQRSLQIATEMFYVFSEVKN